MAYDTITQKFIGRAVGHTCWCGIEFAIPQPLSEYYWHANTAAPGSFTLWCPLGHAMVPAQDPAKELRDQVAREKQRREQAEADAAYQRQRVGARDRQIAARKGQLTKLRNRI